MWNASWSWCPVEFLSYSIGSLIDTLFRTSNDSSSLFQRTLPLLLVKKNGKFNGQKFAQHQMLYCSKHIGYPIPFSTRISFSISLSPFPLSWIVWCTTFVCICFYVCCNNICTTDCTYGKCAVDIFSMKTSLKKHTRISSHLCDYNTCRCNQL